jgi:hypothetical protein
MYFQSPNAKAMHLPMLLMIQYLLVIHRTRSRAAVYARMGPTYDFKLEFVMHWRAMKIK